MKQIVEIIRCDRCGGPDAQTYTELNSKGKPVEIDLDRKCYVEFETLREQAAEILAPIRELADEAGVRPEKATTTKSKPPSAQRAPRICLLCPETRDSDFGMRTHLQNEHGLTGKLTELYGTLCPLDGEQFQLVGHHIRQDHREHDFPHYSHAFVWAQQNGDPHGVVAKQIAALKKVARAA